MAIDSSATVSGRVLGPLARRLPTRRQALAIGMDFSLAELARLRAPLFENLDGEWVAVYEEPWLYFFPQLRDSCVFAARLEQDPVRGRVAEAWVTRDPAVLERLRHARVGGLDAEANAASLGWLLQVVAQPPAERELAARLTYHARLSTTDPNAIESFAAVALELLARTGGQGPLWERAAALGRSIDPANRLYATELIGADRFHPPLAFWAWMLAAPFLALWAVLAVVVAVFELLFGGGSVTFLAVNLAQMLALFGGFGVALMALGHLLGRASAWSVEAGGLRGRTFWGRRAFIAWEDFAYVRGVAVASTGAVVPAPPLSGFRALSRTTGVEIRGWTSGINIWDAHNQLCRRAGAAHMLTQWFRARHFAPPP